MPYTCQEIAETADLAFLAFLRISNFRAFSVVFLFDPLLQHQVIFESFRSNRRERDFC